MFFQKKHTQPTEQSHGSDGYDNSRGYSFGTELNIRPEQQIVKQPDILLRCGITAGIVKEAFARVIGAHDLGEWFHVPVCI